MGDIKSRVIKVVAEKLDISEESITEKSSFTTDLGADSLDIAELLMGFEEEFNCDISEEEAEKITNVGDAIEYIKKVTAPAA